MTSGRKLSKTPILNCIETQVLAMASFNTIESISALLVKNIKKIITPVLNSSNTTLETRNVQTISTNR